MAQYGLSIGFCRSRKETTKPDSLAKKKKVQLDFLLDFAWDRMHCNTQISPKSREKPL